MKLYDLGVIAILFSWIIAGLIGTAIEEDKDLIDIVEEKEGE